MYMHKPSIAVQRRTYGNTHGDIVPKVVVLHSTESHDYDGAKDIIGVLKYLEGTEDRLGVHFVTDAEGLIGQGASIKKMCYHCIGANSFSIGIEQIGFAKFSLTQWMTRRKQLRATAKLLAWMHLRLDIPLVRSVTHGVALHRDFPEGTHWDPGYGYPIKSVLRMAKKYAKYGW